MLMQPLDTQNKAYVLFYRKAYLYQSLIYF
jgi:hypothetical protein